METMRVAIDRPVAYVNSGQFSAELGWRHHEMTHGADTEVLVGVSGRVSLLVGQTPYALEAGDVLTVFPHETIQGDRPTLVASGFIWFHFVQAGLVELGEGLTAAGDQLVLPRFFRLADQTQALLSLQQLLDVAHGENRLPAAAGYQTTLTLLQLANDYANQQIGVGFQQTTINQVKEWIRSHMAERPSVAAVAQQFNLNADYLTRRFKQETGVTLKAYATVVRLDLAKYLLLTTTDPIAAIAEQAFFSDPKYFARLFKEKTQLTPSQYRQAYTHTYLNNNQVDPGGDIHAGLAQLD